MATVVDRLTDKDVLYPFVPESGLGYEDEITGILDCLFVVRNAPEIYSPTFPEPTTRDYYVGLYQLQVESDHNIYTFYAIAPGVRYTFTFTVPADVGIAWVTSDEEDRAYILIDTDRMHRGSGTFPLSFPMTPPPEIEPARVYWNSLEEITSVSFVNEYRHHDPAQRGSLAADTLVKQYAADGDVVRLGDGDNCRLTYDEDSETLYIDGGPGLGQGLPRVFPWDSAPPDIREFYRLRKAGGSEGLSEEALIDVNTATDLTLKLNVRVAAAAVTVAVDGVDVITFGPATASDWQAFTSAITKGRHTVTTTVSAASGSQWKLQLFVGTPSIKTINTLNAEGDLTLEVGGSLQLQRDVSRMSISVPEDVEKD